MLVDLGAVFPDAGSAAYNASFVEGVLKLCDMPSVLLSVVVQEFHSATEQVYLRLVVGQLLVLTLQAVTVILHGPVRLIQS